MSYKTQPSLQIVVEKEKNSKLHLLFPVNAN